MQKNLIKQIYDLTNNACKVCCKNNFNCCDPIFCNETEQQAKILGLKELPKRGSDNTFIANNKCQIDPIYRPFCSCFICPGVFKKLPRRWRRAYLSIDTKIKEKLIPVLKSEQQKGNYKPQIIHGQK
jgi:hypothetical protein